MAVHRSLWFRRLGLLALGVGLGAGVVNLLQCFTPELPACAYRCATAEPRCPEEYECRSDEYCHLKGTTDTCPYTQDLLPPPVRDLSGLGVDLARPPDLSPSDAGPGPG